MKECLKNPAGQTCSAHGICVNGTCTCEPGYHGDVCASDVLGLCPNNCGKHGSCTSTGCDCKYSSEESEHRVYGSTVVDISMTPLSFKPVSFSLLRSPLF